MTGSCILQYWGKYENTAENLISKLSCSVPNLKCFNLCEVRDGQKEIFFNQEMYPKVKFILKRN